MSGKPKFAYEGSGECYSCDLAIKDPAWHKRFCSATGLPCATRGGTCGSQEKEPEPRGPVVDRAKPETTDDLIKESQRIRKTVPQPTYPSILGHVLSPAEAEANRARREKEQREQYVLEHGLPLSILEEKNEPHDQLDLFKFRREPKPVEKPKTTEQVIEKARENVRGYIAAGAVGSIELLHDPRIQALHDKRVQIQEQIEQYELSKEFDKQVSPAYVKSLLKEMSYAQVQEQLQRDYAKLKEERENQNAR